MKLFNIFLLLTLFSTDLLADNRSNQMNPNNSAYWSSRGATAPSDSSPNANYNNNNRSNQMNPNNSAYWSSRGTPAPSGTSGANHNNNNRSNQMNPNNDAYWSSRGATTPSSGKSGTNYNNNNRSNQTNPNNSIYWSSRGIKTGNSDLIKYLSGRVMIQTKDNMDTLFLDNVEMNIKERFISAHKVTGFHDLYLLELNPGGSATNSYYQLLIKNKKNSFDVTKKFGAEGDLKHIVTSHEKGIFVLQFSKHYFKYDKVPKDKKERDKIVKSVLYKDGKLYIEDGDLFNDVLKNKKNDS